MQLFVVLKHLESYITTFDLCFPIAYITRTCSLPLASIAEVFLALRGVKAVRNNLFLRNAGPEIVAAWTYFCRKQCQSKDRCSGSI